MAHNLHDLTFKQLMSCRDFFIETCKRYLPADIVKAIDWLDVELVQTSPELPQESDDMGELSESQADLLYLVTLKKAQDKQHGLISIHYEHCSTPQRLLPLKRAAYGLNALIKYAKVNKIDQDLPMIISLIYYHGKITPYPYSMDLLGLFNDKRLAAKYLFDPKLIDLGQYTDEEIEQHGILAPAEFLFKLAMSRKIGERASRTLGRLIRQTNKGQTLTPYNINVLKYGLSMTEIDNDRFIANIIKELPALEDDVMTAADQLRQEGSQATARAIALNLMNVIDDPKKIAKATKLSLSEVKKLAKEAEAKNK